MPNNFGGAQDHPAYDSRRKLNPKTEFMLGDTLYTLRKDRVIEAEYVDGTTARYLGTDPTLPSAVRAHFTSKGRFRANAGNKPMEHLHEVTEGSTWERREEPKLVVTVTTVALVVLWKSETILGSCSAFHWHERFKFIKY